MLARIEDEIHLKYGVEFEDIVSYCRYHSSPASP